MNKDTNFYNKEGRVYSQKRYPLVDTDYVHYFFKKRRKILMDFLEQIVLKESKYLSLIEVGCADGIIINEIANRFPKINKLVGVDISEGMIGVAKKNNQPRVNFYIRNRDYFDKFNIVVEVGVVNLTDFDAEINFAKSNLTDGGYYICSLASKTSLRSRIKFNETNDGFHHLLSFVEYENKLKNHFQIIKEVPYGLFIPYIWKAPFFARTLQSLGESIFKPFFPNLFHEKIYLLKSKVYFNGSS